VRSRQNWSSRGVLEGFFCGLLRLLVDAGLVEQLVDLAANLLEVGAEVLEDVGGDALTLDEQPDRRCSVPT